MKHTILLLLLCSCVAPKKPESALSIGTVDATSFDSKVLEKKVNYQVYLPKQYEASDAAFPIIYLLHGHGGDEQDWFQADEGNVAHLLDSLISSKQIPPVIAVTLDGANTWYVDSKDSMETTYLSEFIPLIEGEYRVDSESRLIAGNSAGGYGALRFAMKEPTLFSHAILLSPAAYYPLPPSLSSSRKSKETPAFSVDGVFNEEKWKSYAYPTLLDAFLISPTKPKFYISSGDDDAYNIVPVVTDLQQLFIENGVANELRITNGGHDWSVWRANFTDALTNIFQKD